MTSTLYTCPTCYGVYARGPAVACALPHEACCHCWEARQRCPMGHDVAMLLVEGAEPMVVCRVCRP